MITTHAQAAASESWPWHAARAQRLRSPEPPAAPGRPSLCCKRRADRCRPCGAERVRGGGVLRPARRGAGGRHGGRARGAGGRAAALRGRRPAGGGRLRRPRPPRRPDSACTPNAALARALVPGLRDWAQLCDKENCLAGSAGLKSGAPCCSVGPEVQLLLHPFTKAVVSDPWLQRHRQPCRPPRPHHRSAARRPTASAQITSMPGLGVRSGWGPTLPSLVYWNAQADDAGPNYAQMVTDLRSLGALLGALEAAVAGLARGTPGGAPQHGPRHLRTGAALPLISFAGRAVTACYRSA